MTSRKIRQIILFYLFNMDFLLLFNTADFISRYYIIYLYFDNNFQILESLVFCI